jgi:hypothetical protein
MIDKRIDGSIVVIALGSATLIVCLSVLLSL